MNGSYSSRPYLRDYPDKLGTFTLILYGLGGLCIVAALLAATTPPLGSSHLLLMMFIYLLAIGSLLITAGYLIQPIEYRWRWKRTFKHNNACMMLDYRAIDKIIAYMKKNTGYCCVSFQEIAGTIASCLQREGSWRSGVHNTFSWEVMHAYFFFAYGEGELIPTSVPKKP